MDVVDAICAAARPAKNCPAKPPAILPARAITKTPARRELAHAAFVIPRHRSMAVCLFCFVIRRWQKKITIQTALTMPVVSKTADMVCMFFSPPSSLL